MIGGQQIPLTLKQLVSNEQQLAAGQSFLVPPGKWTIVVGPYSKLQWLDPVASIPATATVAPSNVWRAVRQGLTGQAARIVSDGGNFRIINDSGCMAGAAVTNVGSGYTNGVNGVGVTSSAGGSLWRSVVGGLISGTVTTPTPAGSNLTYPPICLIPPPPVGGIQATAHATISAGAIASVVIDNQGGGYTTAPTLFMIADPRDPNNPEFNPGAATPLVMPGVAVTAGAIAAASAGGTLMNHLPAMCSMFATAFTLTGTGTIAGIYCVDPGTAVTSLPTLTVASGAGAATALANFSVTAFVATSGGAGYGNAMPFAVRTITGLATATTVNTQPALEKFITQPRPSLISGTSTAGGAITATGQIVQDGGIGFQVVPLMVVDTGITGGAAPPTAVANATATVGGTTDWFWITPADG